MTGGMRDLLLRYKTTSAIEKSQNEKINSNIQSNA